MKTLKFFRIILAAVPLFFFGACSSIDIQQTLYLGNVDVKAPINTPPLHLSYREKKGGEVTVSPKLIFNQNRSIDAVTDKSFYSTLTAQDSLRLRNLFKEKNLNWAYPSVLIGLDLDFATSSSFSFYGGIHFADESNRSMVGGNIGLGIGGKKGNAAFRFDIGAGFQKSFFDAQTVVKTVSTVNGNSTQNIAVYLDSDNSLNINPFVSVQFNTAYDFPVNFHFQAAYFSQNLLGYTPSRVDIDNPFFNPGSTITKIDQRTDFTIAMWMIGPGLSYRALDNASVHFTVKLLRTTSSEIKSNEWFVLPSFQFDWEF
ncbi:MAG: hypothetical protein L6Q59_13735 [Ignavibacteriaceae bacterium]|nr:hypothetical protein [Ignavibacteriaceae bacterium]